MIRLLVVDDEEPFRRLLKKELSRKGYEVDVAADGRAAVARLSEGGYDVMLLDIMMPGMDGLTLMRELRNDPAAPPIVVLTGKATVETAVEAMKNGAHDYVTKPYKLDELEIVIERAAEFGRLRLKNELLERELVRKEAPPRLIGESPAVRRVLGFVRKIAPTDSTVLIQGESGTGKELVANTIWSLSRRSDRAITALNCATLSENLMESELFGHEKGAFTNAVRTKHGLVEVADRGTLFLDEIAEMPAGLQAKLLRFLDSGEFRRVGGNTVRKVDVRVIAATNKSLSGLVRDGRFREDLFYRLSVINIELPPLRERSSDIPALARFFVEQSARKLGKEVRGISDAALERLSAYAWPGNVRELRNEIERAAILCEHGRIEAEDLSLPAAAAPGPEEEIPGPLEDLERRHIEKVLREVGGNRTRAAGVLGINRKTLYLKLKKYGIRPEGAGGG